MDIAENNNSRTNNHSTIQCIYHRPYGQGVSCDKEGSLKREKLCKTHHKACKSMDTHTLCSVFFLNKPLCIYDQLDTLSIYLNTTEIKSLTCALLCIYLHVYSRFYLEDQLYRLRQNKPKSRLDAAQSLVDFHIRVWTLKTQRPDVIQRGLVSFQRRWKSFMATTCSFTCSSPSELEPDQIVRWVDRRGNVYIASAPHLYHHLHMNGPWNPLNRERLTHSLIDRLELQVESNPVALAVVFELQDPLISTPRAAILRALTYFDECGFYTKIEWFDKLSIRSVRSLYALFPEWTRSMALSSEAFADTSPLYAWMDKNQESGHLFALGEEMMTLVMDTDPEERFRTLCLFLFLLTEVHRKVAAELPTWVRLAVIGE